MEIQRLLNTIVATIALLSSLAALYTFIIDKKTILDIKEISSEKLTNEKLTNICTTNGLHATYSYNNIPVNSVWRLNYKIKNIGNQALKGIGSNKNIIGDNINFNFRKKFKIIDLKRNTHHDDSIRINYIDNIISISFTQWLQKEEIDLTLYLEELTLELGINPELTGNKKEFDNGDIEYSSISSEKISIYNKVPKPLLVMIVLFSITIYIILLLVIVSIWIEQLLIYFSYRKWVKNNLADYNSWIEILRKTTPLKEYKKPKDLPLKYWKTSSTLNQPKVLDKDIEKIIWGGIIVIVLSLFTLSLFYSQI